MPLIEGIGDEVLQFFGIVFAGLLGIFAWWSTNISSSQQLQTIFIVQQMSQFEPDTPTGQRSQQQQQQNSSDRRSPNRESTDGVGETKKRIEVNQRNTTDILDEPIDPTEETPSTEKPLRSQQSDAENFQGEVDRKVPVQGSAESADEPRIDDDTAHDNPIPPDNIRIRLKYLNDEQKLVEGKLQELLGEFKRRNFTVELSRHQRIRLIFNGQVLQRDDKTLQGCGLYDNCVVHCLVHAQSNQNQNNSNQSHTNSSPPDWNLGSVLYALLSAIFIFAWFLRYYYSHLFNFITTGTLLGLTGMFVSSIIGLYLPDQEVPQ